MKALFLGAGASYELGMPTVWELTAEFKCWLTIEKLKLFNQNWKNLGSGYSHITIELIESLLTNKEMHYESMIGSIEDHFKNERNTKLRKELHAFQQLFLQAIYGLLLERTIRNHQYMLSGLELFQGLKLLTDNNNPLWIFSLNHDVILEYLAASLNIPIKSGFNEQITIQMSASNGDLTNYLEFELLSEENRIKNNFDFFQPGEFGINLIKLHGSLDIFSYQDGHNYLKIKTNGSLNCTKQLLLIEKIDRSIAFNHKINTINESLYYDNNGELQFLRKSLLSGSYKFHPNMHQIAPKEFLPLFDHNLAAIDHLVCIGYGFGDKHINNILQNWLSSDDKNHLDIVNPGIEKCPSLFDAHVSKITTFTKTASDYFMSLEKIKDEHLDAKRQLRLSIRDRLKDSLINKINQV